MGGRGTNGSLFYFIDPLKVMDCSAACMKHEDAHCFASLMSHGVDIQTREFTYSCITCSVFFVQLQDEEF